MTASQSTNRDLYWALRGGANNFGIVTTFTLRTFPQGEIFVSQVSYGDNQSESVLDEVYRLWTDPRLTADVEGSFDMAFIYNATSDQFLMTGTERHESPSAQPPVFAALDEVPTLSRRTRNATMANLTSVTPSLGTTR